MRKLLGILFCALVALVGGGCGGNDSAKVVEYLQGLYFAEKIERQEKVPGINILRTKSIKAYNPTLDANKRNVAVFYETSLQKITKAMTSKADDTFDVFVDAFSTDPNSDAVVVEFEFPTDKQHRKLYNILFEKNGVFYDNYEHVGRYAARIGYEYKKAEILQNIKDNLE